MIKNDPPRGISNSMGDEVILPSPSNGQGQFDWGPKNESDIPIIEPYSDAEIEERARKVIESQYDTEPPEFTIIDPAHYRSHPSGVECIEIIECMTYNIGASIKYLWRHGLKAGADTETDLRKALWHIQRELKRLGYER